MNSNTLMKKHDLPKTIISRDGNKSGKPTGSIRPCSMEGCTGMRIGVRWVDGKLTYPCTKGMDLSKTDTWRIA